MARDGKYEFTTKLHHGQKLAIINDDGEVIEIDTTYKKKKEPADKSMMYFDFEGASYQRHFTKGWQLLETQTTAQELRAAYKLADMAHIYTNALAPICQETSIKELSELLGIHRNYVEKIINKLFKLGVIAKFEVADANEEYKKFYVFNSFLRYNGKTIKKDVHTLFSNTTYALIYNK